MTHKEIAARLRDIADRESTDVWRELYALARELDDGPYVAALPETSQDDMEALVRATQPARRRGLLGMLRGRR